METYTVLSATEYYITSTDLGWRLVLRRESDQATGLYIFPQSSFEWRAAEYGLDPTDVETLLDIILHEPYTPDPPTVESDPAYLEGGLYCARTSNLGVHRVGDPTPVTLLTAETTEQARTAMLLRIAHAKTTRATVQTLPPTTARHAAMSTLDPLAKVRSSIHLSATDVEEKTRYVELRRKEVSGELTPAEAQELSELANKPGLVTKLDPTQEGGK